MSKRKQKNMKFGAETAEILSALSAGPDYNATRIFELALSISAPIFHRSHKKALHFLYATLLDEIQRAEKTACNWPDLLQLKTEHAILIRLADSCASKNDVAIAKCLAEFNRSRDKYRIRESQNIAGEKISA